MAILKVGAGKICISPRQDMFPFYTMKRYYDGVYNDLYCRCIVIDHGDNPYALLSFELNQPPINDEITKRVSEATNIPQNNIFISATHNHTGPRPIEYCLNNNDYSEEDLQKFKKYLDFVYDCSVEVTKHAVSNLRPAKYGYGESESFINTNRDLEIPGGWVEGRNLAGESDKTLSVVKFEDLDGNLIAALLNHPTHATCCYNVPCSDGQYRLSGNFTSITSCFVERHYGNGAVAMWTSGAAGNQNPLLSHGLQMYEADGFSSTYAYPDGVLHMMMDHIGQTHGMDAIEGIDRITCTSSYMPIAFIRRKVSLPTHKLAVGDPGAGNVISVFLANRGPRPKNIPYGTVPDQEYPVMIDDTEHPLELHIHLLMLGTIAVVGVSGELYLPLGKMIKEISPFKKTVVITHIRHDSVGYILDKESAKKVRTFQYFSRVKPGGSDNLIRQAVSDLFEELLKNPE